MIKISKSYKAFTLIELLLYSGIIGVLIIAASILALQTYSGYAKNVNYNTLVENGRFTLGMIAQEIQTADSINLSDSIFNQDQGKLSLQRNTPLPQATIFQIENGTVIIQKTGQQNIPVTSRDIRITQLRFENVSALKTPGTIRTTLTLEYMNLGNRPEQNAQMTLTETTNLRRL